MGYRVEYGMKCRVGYRMGFRMGYGMGVSIGYRIGWDMGWSVGWVGIHGRLWDEMEHKGGVQDKGISGNDIPQA